MRYVRTTYSDGRVGKWISEPMNQCLVGGFRVQKRRIDERPGDHVIRLDPLDNKMNQILVVKRVEVRETWQENVVGGVTSTTT